VTVSSECIIFIKADISTHYLLNSFDYRVHVKALAMHVCVCTPSLMKRDKKNQEKVNIIYLSSECSFIKIKAVTLLLAQLPIANSNERGTTMF